MPRTGRSARAPRSRRAAVGARVAAGILAVVAAMAVGASAPVSGASTPQLTLVKTVYTRHGNAAHVAWSDDGKSLYLANEEGIMSAVRIDVSDPMHPQIAATGHAANFLFAVSQRRGVLVFRQSYGVGIVRDDPATLAPVWMKKAGPGHAVVTDGSRIYFAEEGTPGALVVYSPDGSEVGRVQAPGPWPQVYGMTYDADAHLLFVAAFTPPPQNQNRAPQQDQGGTPPQPQGTVYIYDTGRTPPALVGQIDGATNDLAVAHGRLWMSSGTDITAWDVSTPAHPRQLGAFEGPPAPTGQVRARMLIGNLATNAAGTRLYATYVYGPYPPRPGGGGAIPDASAGFLILNSSGTSPTLLAQNDWAEGQFRIMPTALALSPDGRTIAVSYWRFGVRLFGVADDKITDLGRVATTGEAHDVYVDAHGILYVFANDDLQIIDPATGQHLQDLPLFQEGDGGWAPFRDGTVIVGSDVMLLEDGQIKQREMLPRPGNVLANVYADPYLYSVLARGTLVAQRITETAPYHYAAEMVGNVTVPPPPDPRAPGGPSLLAVAKQGSYVWALGPNEGVVKFDVSRPENPTIVSQDRFTFGTNGMHVGIVVAHGRVYAGAGDQGVIIYDADTMRRTGHIDGVNANFLDTIGGDFLVVANYWQARLPEGALVFDLRTQPDNPPLVDRFPKPDGNANFRLRVFGQRVYRAPLYGIDILDWR